MVSQSTYQTLSLEDQDNQWELRDGRLVEKPSMSFAHNEIMAELGFMLRSQLAHADFMVRVNAGRLRRGERTYYIPDVMVIPRNTTIANRPEPASIEIYDQPLPFVAEVWSPSTGDYDIDDKIPGYQARGDLEIWRLHPYERTLTVWRRRDDGGYDESMQKGGVADLVGLPKVTVDLDRLFDLL
jgi:Uma2 family endonuclease